MAISMGIFLLVVMFVLLFLGAPMMVGLLLAPVLAILRYMPDIDLMWLAQQATGGIEVFSLLAVPMFIFAADIMSYGQTSKRLLICIYICWTYKRWIGNYNCSNLYNFRAISGSTSNCCSNRKTNVSGW